MYLFLKGLKDLLKGNDTVIDNTVFRLHYRVTATLIAACSVLVGASQYFGDPISCNSTTDIPASMFNTVCWIHGTWTIDELMTNRVAADASYPGLGFYDGRVHKKTYHRYYQWVPIVLALSAMAFYVPRQLWKSIEGGRMSHVCEKMKFPDYGEKGVEANNAERLFYHVVYNRKQHRVLGFLFVVCEFLNMANVVVQWFLADYLLNGNFMDYGSRFISFYKSHGDDPEATNPTDLIFPKMSMCTYYSIGKTGSKTQANSVCVLPQNIVNEKVCLVIWLWFVFLMFISGLALIFRILVFIFPPLRKSLMYNVSEWNNSPDVAMVCDNCSYGEWFVLHLIKLNVSTRTCSKLIEKLAEDRQRLINKENRAFNRAHGHRDRLGSSSGNSTASSTLEKKDDKILPV